jgi:pectinesterase
VWILVINSRFTGDSGYQGSFKAKLGRAWDQGRGRNLPVKPLTVRVLMPTVLSIKATIGFPWGAAATTARPFRGNPAAERQLDDVAFNRLWEFNNHWQP